MLALLRLNSNEMGMSALGPIVPLFGSICLNRTYRGAVQKGAMWMDTKRTATVGRWLITSLAGFHPNWCVLWIVSTAPRGRVDQGAFSRHRL